MAEYIERETAVDALSKVLFAYEEKTEAQFKYDPELDISEWFFHRIFVQDMNGIDRQTILDIPAADVRPVVRGKWKPIDLTYGRSYYFCSACEETVDMPTAMSIPMFRYCPNCGADMRGE